jgi:hypothetical protein
VERTTIAGETEVLGENLPQRHFVPPQIPHAEVRFRTPDSSGGKQAINRLSYGAALHTHLVLLTLLSKFLPTSHKDGKEWEHKVRIQSATGCRSVTVSISSV